MDHCVGRDRPGAGYCQLLRTGHVSWIPSLGLAAAAGGLGMGILYTALMLVTEDWRDSLADTPGMTAQLGPPVLCGTGAGLVAGLLAGGFSGAAFLSRWARSPLPSSIGRLPRRPCGSERLPGARP